jgi:hypothetical protein
VFPIGQFFTIWSARKEKLQKKNALANFVMSVFDSFEDFVDRLCGLVVRVPGYRTEMYCVSCEVRTEFMYVM